MYDKDPYAILGIPPTASASQIKQAYHRLARQYHPDLNKDPRAIERMKDINWANSILSHAHERSLYDHWRSSGIRVEFHPRPGSPSQPYNAPPRNPPSSSAGQAQTPRTGYSTNRPAQTSSPTSHSQGCSSSLLVWIIVIMLMNVGRIFRSTSQPVYYSTPRNVATQTANFVRMNAIIDTFHASQNLGTEDSSFIVLTYLAPQMTSTPTGMNELTDEFGHPDLRPSIVPGSQEWEWIHQYFPDLTTPNGLSEEVTIVIYDQLRNGYQIKTRSDGEYWILINRYDRSIMPAHYPPAETATPTP